MHLIDALDAGGAERVAVNMANLLPADRYAAHLCTTRRDGALDSLVAPHVGRLRLRRRSTFDLAAIHRLRQYVARHDIRILHAHETALFTATAAALLPPFPAVVWHDHFGRHGIEARRLSLYRLPARRARAVISVSPALAEWAVQSLGLPIDRVHFIPNFVAPATAVAVPPLPGSPGSRIVCVANFRRQKDHPTLLRALAIVRSASPTAHLLLAGDEVDAAYAAEVRRTAADLGVDDRVTFLGSRDDVAGILRGSDVGVLSSASEGLPLALLEYGHAALATVATSVGASAEVLADGAAGRLVPAGHPAALAAAIVDLLDHPERRRDLGRALQAHVMRNFSGEAGIARVAALYDRILGVVGEPSPAPAF
jgi:glycosyltransferase involved in cell wall biosynthesis